MSRERAKKDAGEATRKLQTILEKINKKREEEEEYQTLELLLRGLLYGGKWVRLSQKREYLLIRNEGAVLRFIPESELRDPGEEKFVVVANLVNAVGADRVRRCQLEGCGRWFIARKAQQYCTYVHAQRDRDRRKQEARNE